MAQFGANFMRHRLDERFGIYSAHEPTSKAGTVRGGRCLRRTAIRSDVPQVIVR